jgi:plastocyanin
MSEDVPPATDSTAAQPGGAGALLVPVGLALLVAAAVYAATQIITPDPTTSLFGQSAADTNPLKAWLASGMLALAMFQVYSALWIYGRLHRGQPAWLPRAHRLSGYAAIVLSLPIAYHCLFAYGFENFDTRTLVHSLFGCFFYGAFAAKVFIVRSNRFPGWALPVAGGVMVTMIVVLWYSAALWYFNDFSVPFLSPSTSSSAPYTAPAGAVYGQGSGNGSTAAPGAKLTGDAVTIQGFAFQPPDFTVTKGTTVKFTNEDAAPHTATATDGSFDTGIINQGETKSLTFDSPGNFNFICSVHPYMKGTVTVKP